MSRAVDVRRSADGSLDIGYYRRKARRLRRLARRRTWRTCLGIVAQLLAPWRAEGARAKTATGWPSAMLGCTLLAAAAARTEETGATAGITAAPLHVARAGGAPEVVHRLYILEFGPDAGTVRRIALGDKVALVAEGAMIVSSEGEGVRILAAGEAHHLRPMVPHVLRNASTTAPARLVVSSVTPAGLPPAVPAPPHD